MKTKLLIAIVSIISVVSVATAMYNCESQNMTEDTPTNSYCEVIIKWDKELS